MTPGLALDSRKEKRKQPLNAEESSVPQRSPAYDSLAACGTSAGLPMRAVYLVSDLLAIALSIAIAVGLGCWWFEISWQSLGSVDLKIFGILGVALMAVSALQRSYAAIPPRPVRQFRGWVLGAAAAVAIEMTSLWLFGVAAGWHLVALAIAAMLAIIIAAFNRAMCRVLFGKRAWWGTRLIVVGCDGLAASVFDDLRREPQWGLRPVGFVDDAYQQRPDAVSPNFLGPLDALDGVARGFHVTRALAAVDTFNAEELAELMCKASGRIQHWIIVPPLDQFPCMWLDAVEAAHRPALAVTNRLALARSYLVKRLFDLILTLSMSGVLLPVLGSLMLLVRVTSRGPVFYGQQRVGRYGRRFTAWKFRTMVPDADKVLNDYLQQHPELQAEWNASHKLKHDPRVTAVGRWLRWLSLDELPQVWNVIVGEMSLVGPRPIVAEEVDKYADRFRHYAQVLPGVTGMWQVSGRNNTTYEERVDLDAYYVENWSLWLDLYILACTVKVVVLGEGAY